MATETQVLIVGAGGAGLTASVLLGQQGIDSYLVERHPGTSLVPKAHIIHSRSLEILRQMELDKTVREEGVDPKNFTHTTWYTSLGGEEPWDRKLLATIPSWSYSTLAPFYAKLTASPMTNLPQHLLEPVIRERAEELNGADRVLFNHEVTELDQDDDGVTATILDRETGETSTIRAQYVIGADGGKTIGSMLGVEMIGPEPFVDVVSLTFEADFSPYLQEDNSLIRLFLQPQLDGSARRFSIVAGGPPWDRRTRQWRSGVVLPAGVNGDRPEYTAEDAIQELRTLMKLPELEITNMQLSHWLIESVYAERFQVGRVFLAGDAAHRHSPMGGLGLNTGIQDAHNIAWKLAAVINGFAPPALLNTYEPERLPVGRRRVEFATFSFFNHLSVAGGFGMLPGAADDHNRDVLDRLFSETPDGETRRSQLTEMIFTLRREFQHADIDLGFEYADSPGVVPDGSEAPPRDPVGHEYVQVARPGHRMPHAWLERDGERIPTHDLVDPGAFLLLAGADGLPWRDAAERLSKQLEVPVHTYLVGPDGDLVDAEGVWEELRGHAPDGAILVRPDGHVAFRATSISGDVENELRGALEVALGFKAAASEALVTDR